MRGYRSCWVLVLSILVSLLLSLSYLTSSLPSAPDQPLNPNPPSTPVRLVFIHHSTGEDWLNLGGLREALNENNYYVTETNYDWGPPDLDVNDGNPIGYHTDIGHWYNWFLGPHRDTYLQALYTSSYTTGENSIPDPGGENVIIMFKSCFSSGQVIYGNPDDPPLPKGAPNPLWGKGVCDDPQCSGSEYYTVSNIKGLYRDLLDYFATRQDKMFVLITTPPSVDVYISPELAANLRAINTWLVYHWLEDYPYNNVFVFDYYNVLTSNGGDPNTSDVGSESGNHHRYWNGQVQHVIGVSNDFLAYPSFSDGQPDNHPNPVGHRKATEEFVTLLNIAYHCWKGDGGRPLYMGRSGAPAPGKPSPTPATPQPTTPQPTPQAPPATSPAPPLETPTPPKGISPILAGAGIVILAIVGVALYLTRKARSEVDERLRKLDEALLEGRISEETYQELKRRYERERERKR
ncbi:MAG: hypothetical protein DRO05_05580 [Thermoproteota archaeon]|nr:MAG: hypothetical protein DRO05_05580 [Candidatus Korarchaeota archaeon]